MPSAPIVSRQRGLVALIAFATALLVLACDPLPLFAKPPGTAETLARAQQALGHRAVALRDQFALRDGHVVRFLPNLFGRVAVFRLAGGARA